MADGEAPAEPEAEALAEGVLEGEPDAEGEAAGLAEGEPEAVADADCVLDSDNEGVTDGLPGAVWLGATGTMNQVALRSDPPPDRYTSPPPGWLDTAAAQPPVATPGAWVTARFEYNGLVDADRR